MLAQLGGAELPAAVHYMRSLAAPQPFPISKNNLALLFDANTEKHAKLPARGAPAGNGRGGAAADGKRRLRIDQHLAELCTRCVRLHGAPALPGQCGMPATACAGGRWMEGAG